MARLDGRVALITGGARGVGRATALKLASEGADIIIGDVQSKVASIPYSQASGEDLQGTQRAVEALGRRCVAQPADVRSQSDLDDLVAEGIGAFGHIDIVCANAGVHAFARAWEITDEAWDEVIAVNLTGAWRTAKAIAPHMIDRLQGVIVFTASIQGRGAGPELAHYCAAKHGVLGLMKALAIDLGEFNVRVNAVLPTVIHTPMGDNPRNRAWICGRDDATTEDYVNATRHWHLLRGRAALPATALADAIMWLVSDEAMHVTGIELTVDAGNMILPGFNPRPIVDGQIAVGPYEEARYVESQ